MYFEWLNGPYPHTVSLYYRWVECMPFLQVGSVRGRCEVRECRKIEVLST